MLGPKAGEDMRIIIIIIIMHSNVAEEVRIIILIVIIIILVEQVFMIASPLTLVEFHCNVTETDHSHHHRAKRWTHRATILNAYQQVT